MMQSLEPVLPIFKSQAAEATFQNAYDRLLDSWDITYASQWTRSAFGDTHVITAGPLDGEPLILIPGAQGTAAMWGPMLPKIIEKRRVYALDLIDQVGRSRPTRILRNTRDSGEWIKQTLDSLNLSKADFVGNSIGSFITASFALQYPERVKKIVLTAPAATVSDISLSYILRVLLTMGLPFDGLIERFLRKTSADKVGPENPLFALLCLAMSSSKVISKVIPRALTDTELATLKMPVLLILGDQDPVNKSPSPFVYDKMTHRLPDVKCEILPGAGHLWNETQLQKCGQLIEQFLN